ncbi:hypothetical protein LTR56_024143 [Elasticomyces elasticus]|nr:hypothetical protein LTR56_024143 [Elasticomyces elasticus]KAK3628192.1 hypothetical protein LTR22_022450 [Elasticomyces elasticus]KAK4904659.1 hypothetical protein LTR49_025928 [Elasticomyces elasticus]
MAGDVSVIPQNMAHFIENLSDDEDLEVLEIFRADTFMDFSLFSWMGVTPARLNVENAEKDVMNDLWYKSPEYQEEL